MDATKERLALLAVVVVVVTGFAAVVGGGILSDAMDLTVESEPLKVTQAKILTSDSGSTMILTFKNTGSGHIKDLKLSGKVGLRDITEAAVKNKSGALVAGTPVFVPDLTPSGSVLVLATDKSATVMTKISDKNMRVGDTYQITITGKHDVVINADKSLTDGSDFFIVHNVMVSLN